MPRSTPQIRRSAASMAADASSWLCRGRYVRSMSTEIRGRSSTNRLIAVPPLSAKHSSFATKGRISTSSCIWRQAAPSVSIIDIARQGDQESLVQDAVLGECALAASELHSCEIQPVEPGVVHPRRESQKEALHLDAAAILQQIREQPRTQGCQPIKQQTFVLQRPEDRLIQHLQVRALERRDRQFPGRLAPAQHVKTCPLAGAEKRVVFENERAQSRQRVDPRW